MLDAHLRPRGTWFWLERLSRVLRGCCAAAVPFPIRARAAIVSVSIQPRSRKQWAPQTRLCLNKLAKIDHRSTRKRSVCDLQRLLSPPIELTPGQDS